MSKPAARVCATSSARAPSAENQMPSSRPALALQPVEQTQHFAGRVARQKVADQHAGRRAQHVELLLQPAADTRRSEALRSDGRAEQVAIAQQEFAVGPQAVLGAIGDIDELVVFFQPRRQRPADRGELVLLGPFDAYQDQAGHHAFAQFVDQETLYGRRRARQEGGKVRAVLRPRNDDRASQYESKPDADAQARRRVHRASSTIFMTDRSPPASWTSMISMRAWLPSMRTRLMTSFILRSRGTR